jgi:hypothetical protein
METTMTTIKTRKTARNLVLAAAALLTLGTASIATSTDASAWGFRGGFHGGGFHGGFRGGFHGGFRGGFHGYRFGHFGWNHYRFGGWNHFGWNHYRFGWNRYGWNRWRYPGFGCHFYHNCYRPGPILSGYGPGPVVGGAPTASVAPVMQAAVTAPQPSCLLKQYGPDGAVMFMDRCTQESAISPPPGAQAPQGQAPQQQ